MREKPTKCTHSLLTHSAMSWLFFSSSCDESKLKENGLTLAYSNRANMVHHSKYGTVAGTWDQPVPLHQQPRRRERNGSGARLQTSKQWHTLSGRLHPVMHFLQQMDTNTYFPQQTSSEWLYKLPEQYSNCATSIKYKSLWGTFYTTIANTSWVKPVS